MIYRKFFVAVLGASLVGPASATAITYNFNLSNGLFSRNCQLLEDISRQVPVVLDGGACYVADGGAYGSFTYDNAGTYTGDNSQGASLYDATVSSTATPVAAGSDLGTISANNGSTIVNDDPGGDLLNIGVSNASDNWSGLTIGDYQFVTVGVIWVGGDFLADQALPGMLPPPDGYENAIVNFGIVNTNTPMAVDGIAALGLVVTPVPIPAAAWLFATAVGMLGWIRRKPA